MSQVIELLAEITRLGIELELVDGRLRARPSGALPASLRKRVLDSKHELGLLLARRNSGEVPPDCTDTTDSATAAATVGSVVSASEGPIAVPRGGRTTPCYACGGTSFWSGAALDNWICAGCHAPELQGDAIKWMNISSSTRAAKKEWSAIGCAACRGSGFRWMPGSTWAVCARCNGGWIGGAE